MSGWTYTGSTATANTPATHLTSAATVKKKAGKKVRKKTVKEALPGEPGEPTGTSAGGRTFAENSNWDPNASSATGNGLYRLPSFDARRIIYPGANGDPWWDMLQLIAQVSVFFVFLINTLRLM